MLGVLKTIQTNMAYLTHGVHATLNLSIRDECLMPTVQKMFERDDPPTVLKPYWTVLSIAIPGHYFINNLLESD
jgi:hypothetical protein